MTAINLPGQLEVPLVVDHKKPAKRKKEPVSAHLRAFKIANLLRLYEQRPSSELWTQIQALSIEILKPTNKD